MDILLLAIESSCDDTAAAVLCNDKVLANVVSSQKVHAAHGGIIPEFASRAHLQNLVPVVDAALHQADVAQHQLNAIAFTRGPGLIGSLLTGVMFAKGMALALHIPLIEVNHMQAHVLSVFLNEPKPRFPFLCLTVSGGHTQLVLVQDYLHMQVLGETRDDAAGEAFDKTAKLLGFPYPGGPLIDRYAQKGNPDAFRFGQPIVEGWDFSFSGLKTSVLYFLRSRLQEDPNFIKNNLHDLCASIQKSIVDILIKKLVKAAQQLQITEIAVAGGVAANSGLRKALAGIEAQYGWKTYVPSLEYCTDNAAMIGITGYYKYLKKEFAGHDINPLARYAL
ncbi:MAG: tRNA N6-adenosine threonylcarbamoyltransferase [Chitinophagales bacterium]|nr:MAG: tRNA N6-adenosine threonylcarbamoyltransferase [Chitinophagales bacterium]